MKLYSNQFPVRIAFILILIGSFIFCTGVLAKIDSSNESLLVENQTENNFDEATTEPVISPTTVLTAAPVDVTAEPTITETTEISEPTVTATVTMTVTISPTEETPEPIVTGSLTEIPAPNETTAIPTNVPTNVQQTSSDSLATVSSEHETYVSNELIVRYNYKKIANKGLLTASSAKTNMEIGAVVQQDFSNEGLPGMQVVRIPDNMSVDDAIAIYENSPDILYAEPNYIVKIATTPSDSDYALQWGLHNTGQHIGDSAGTVDADIDAPEAWDLSTGSNSIVVAVVDTGVDYDHPDLSTNIWTNADEIGGNDIDDDSNGYPDDVHGWDFEGNTSDPMDMNSYLETYHGTHCAGIVGAVGNNGIGVSGVAWNVKIMPLRFLNETGSGTIANATKAILYANANGADVISNSWGGYSESQALKDAIDSSSAVVVCAAGNDASDNDGDYPFYPASLTSANIISVAATDNKDVLADFSNYGATSVDLAAPGVTIYSTKKSSSYQNLSGTSMATPFVAGVAALIKAENSSLTAAQIKNAILDNVDVKSSLSGKVLTGGRLNAFDAVSTVMVRDKIGYFNSSTKTWYLDKSGNGVYGTGDLAYNNYGIATDVQVTGDWDGDGTTEIGIFRPSTKTWYLDKSGNGVYGAGDLAYNNFGIATDVQLIGKW